MIVKIKTNTKIDRQKCRLIIFIFKLQAYIK